MLSFSIGLINLFNNLQVDVRGRDVHVPLLWCNFMIQFPEQDITPCTCKYCLDVNHRKRSFMILSSKHWNIYSAPEIRFAFLQWTERNAMDEKPVEMTSFRSWNNGMRCMPFYIQRRPFRYEETLLAGNGFQLCRWDGRAIALSPYCV